MASVVTLRLVSYLPCPRRRRQPPRPLADEEPTVEHVSLPFASMDFLMAGVDTLLRRGERASCASSTGRLPGKREEELSAQDARSSDQPPRRHSATVRAHQQPVLRH